MAYEGGGLRQFWKPDLSTRASAQAAMDSAKFCFLIVAGFRVVVYAIAAFAGGMFTGAVPAGAPMMIVSAFVALDIAVPLLAAWRLHLHRGAFVVPVATILYVIGILTQLSVMALIIGVIFTGVFVGGIRGAWALRSNRTFEDDHYATFS
jgi:hypothetical protein